MTINSQTSVISTQSYSRKRYHQNTYQIVINGEDGNYQEYEVEASSIAEASNKANAIAAENMVDITYVEIYKIY